MTNKLLVINDFSHIGGAEQVVLRLCRFLQETNNSCPWKIDVVTSEKGPFSHSMTDIIGRDCHFIDFTGLKRNWKQIRYWKQFRLEMKNVLADLQPDIVLCNSIWSAIAAQKPVHGMNIPIVCALHASIQPKRLDKQLVFQLAGSMLTRKIDGWIAVSSRMAREIQSLKVSPQTIRVIPNGVNLPDSTELVTHGPWRTRSGIDPDHIVIAALGRLHPGKGQHTVLNAFAEIASDHSNVTLALVGEEIVSRDEPGGYTDTLKEIINNKNLEKRVILTGFIDDAAKILTEVDIVASGSTEESFGLAVLEGMAAGRAVVATDITGHNDLISHETNGLLVPVHNETRMADALNQLITNDQLRQRLGQAARKTSSQYDLRTTLLQWAVFLEQMAHQKPHPHRSSNQE